MKKGKSNGNKKAWRVGSLILLAMSTCFFWAILSSPASAQDKFERFHIRFEAGYFLSDWLGGNFKKLLTSWGYDYTTSGSYFFGRYTNNYPKGTQGNFFMSLKFDYSLSPRWALRLTVTPAAKWNIEGRKLIYKPNYQSYELLLESQCKSGSYYAGFVYSTKRTQELNPNLHGASYAYNLGAGVGLEDVNLKHELPREQASYIEIGSKNSKDFSKLGIGSYVFAELEYFIGRHSSIAGHLSYKYVLPIRFESFQLPYLKYEGNKWDPVQQKWGLWENGAAVFPEHKVNFGGLRFGFDIGYHF